MTGTLVENPIMALLPHQARQTPFPPDSCVLAVKDSASSLPAVTLGTVQSVSIDLKGANEFVYHVKPNTQEDQRGEVESILLFRGHQLQWGPACPVWVKPVAGSEERISAIILGSYETSNQVKYSIQHANDSAMVYHGIPSDAIVGFRHDARHENNLISKEEPDTVSASQNSADDDSLAHSAKRRKLHPSGGDEEVHGEQDRLESPNRMELNDSKVVVATVTPTTSFEQESHNIMKKDRVSTSQISKHEPQAHSQKRLKLPVAHGEETSPNHMEPAKRRKVTPTKSIEDESHKEYEGDSISVAVNSSALVKAPEHPPCTITLQQAEENGSNNLSESRHRIEPRDADSRAQNEERMGMTATAESDQGSGHQRLDDAYESERKVSRNSRSEESTIRVIIPPFADEMRVRGAIIGRKGGNIHKLENSSGCRIVVDGYPFSRYAKKGDPVSIAVRGPDELVHSAVEMVEDAIVKSFPPWEQGHVFYNLGLANSSSETCHDGIVYQRVALGASRRNWTTVHYITPERTPYISLFLGKGHCGLKQIMSECDCQIGWYGKSSCPHLFIYGPSVETVKRAQMLVDRRFEWARKKHRWS